MQFIQKTRKSLIIETDTKETLLNTSLPIRVVEGESGFRIEEASIHSEQGRLNLSFTIPPVSVESLGDPNFQTTHGCTTSFYAGAMANAIASEEMVIALGKAGMLGSFGSAGLAPEQVEKALLNIQEQLAGKPFMVNLIFNPNEPYLEQSVVDLYLKHQVRVIEASAFVDLSKALVHYRVAGLDRNSSGSIRINNRVVAKLSRKEVARRFMEPAPKDIVMQLLQEGKINAQQADLASLVPVADDVTVEADSGGHTDNRPLVNLLPTIIALRDEIQKDRNYLTPIRVGGAGGISTPESALAAFMLGAAYIVTGSINQACMESGASEHTKRLLAQADMADVAMAPAADMFEMGVRVQVLKRGTLFPMRAQKLYELYSRYNSIEEIPAEEREKLERVIFKRSLESIWEDTVRFFQTRDPHQIERGQKDPRQKMALIFRWYLGLSSRWSNSGEKGREMDYQIWCGPSLGSFNDWTRGTYLEKPENRHVVDVTRHLMTGCAYLIRLRMLALYGIQIPDELNRYIPTAPMIES